MAERSVLKIPGDRVSWREVDGHVVALHLKSSTYVTANATGSLLWKRLVDGATADELVDQLVETFRLERPAAESDVAAFLRMLIDAEILPVD